MGSPIITEGKEERIQRVSAFGLPYNEQWIKMNALFNFASSSTNKLKIICKANLMFWRWYSNRKKNSNHVTCISQGKVCKVSVIWWKRCIHGKEIKPWLFSLTTDAVVYWKYKSISWQLFSFVDVLFAILSGCNSQIPQAAKLHGIQLYGTPIQSPAPCPWSLSFS